MVWPPLLNKGMHAFIRFQRRIVQGEPIASVTDGLVPGEVFPEVRLLLGVAHAFGELVYQLGSHGSNGVIKLGVGYNLVDQAPVEGGPGIDPFTQPKNLARSPVSNHHRQPLRRTTCGNAAHFCANLANAHMIGSDSQVTGHVELISTANNHAIEPGNRRLANIAQDINAVCEESHPLPIIVWALRVLGGILLNVASSAECLVARASKHNDCNMVIPRGVAECLRHLLQRAPGVGVIALWAIYSHSCFPTTFAIHDLLKAKALSLFPFLCSLLNT
jgi:hypothetical protein